MLPRLPLLDMSNSEMVLFRGRFCIQQVTEYNYFSFCQEYTSLTRHRTRVQVINFKKLLDQQQCLRQK
jgi:hypothetical protein